MAEHDPVPRTGETMTWQEAWQLAKRWMEDADKLAHTDPAGWTMYEAQKMGEAAEKVREAALALDRAAQYRGARQGDL